VIRILEERKQIKKLNTLKRTSAVLIALCTVNGAPSLLLTKRSRNLNSSRSEISFPGGKVEHGDRNDPCETAVRETCEELGITRDVIDLWGEIAVDFETTFAANRFLTTPVLASMGRFEDLKFDLSKGEVSNVYAIPIADLNNPMYQRYTIFKAMNMNELLAERGLYYITVFNLPQCHIWGLTSYLICGVLPFIYPDFKHIAKFKYVK